MRAWQVDLLSQALERLHEAPAVAEQFTAARCTETGAARLTYEIGVLHHEIDQAEQMVRLVADALRTSGGRPVLQSELEELEERIAALEETASRWLEHRVAVAEVLSGKLTAAIGASDTLADPTTADATSPMQDVSIAGDADEFVPLGVAR